MDVSNISSSALSMMKANMEAIKVKIDDAVSEANEKNGNALGASLDLSNPAQLLSKLAQLQSADPEKFKSLMSDISASLTKAAEEVGTDTAEGKMLSGFAAKFKSAGETGDLSQLQPPQKPAGSGGPGGPGKAGGAGGAGGASGTAETGETTTCSVCGAEIAENASTCSQCGAPVEEEESATNVGTDSSKIAQYQQSASDSETKSLLDLLSQLEKDSDDSSSSTSSLSKNALSSVRDMLSNAFQQLIQNKKNG
ncbi:MAG: zinc ribbon domain-containing protein [bacterium]